MAISTDAIIEFFGTKDEITATPSAVADTAFSVAADVDSTWANDDDATHGTAILKLTAAGLTGAPAANSTVDLFARVLNINGTDDQFIPDANFPHTYLGSFPIHNTDADQLSAIEFVFPNTASGQVIEFYIRNNMGVSTGTTWQLFVVPKSYGPHA